MIGVTRKHNVQTAARPIKKFEYKTRLYHRAMNIPEGTLLTVEDFTLELIAFLVDTRLGFGLHENEFPFPREHLLKTGKVLCFVVGQLKSRLVLHRPLAQVDGVVRVLWLPAVTRPEIRRLIHHPMDN